MKQWRDISYLPHRQFRKQRNEDSNEKKSYLPHRQFRKKLTNKFFQSKRYLPHRQFRNLPAADGCTEFSYLPSRQFRKLKLCKKWAKRIIVRLRTLAENGGSTGLCAWCRSKLPKDGKQKDTAPSPANRYHPLLDTVGNAHGIFSSSMTKQSCSYNHPHIDRP